MQNVPVVECCESEIAVVCDAVTHRVHFTMMCFCSSHWKKDVRFRLLTLEASDFIHI